MTSGSVIVTNPRRQPDLLAELIFVAIIEAGIVQSSSLPAEISFRCIFLI